MAAAVDYLKGEVRRRNGDALILVTQSDYRDKTVQTANAHVS